MPDFSKERNKDRKRVRGTSKARTDFNLQAPKSLKSKSKQGPLSVFKQIARDFQHGISSLQRMVSAKPESQSSQTIREIIREPGSALREVSREPGFFSKETVRKGASTVREIIREHTRLPERRSSTFVDRERPEKHIVTREVRERGFRVTPAQARAPQSEERQSGSPRLPAVPATASSGGGKPSQLVGIASKSHKAPKSTDAGRLRGDLKPGGVIEPFKVSRTHRTFNKPARPFEIAQRRGFASSAANVTTADREAALQVSEPYTGALHQLPAAARVAQVIRAEAILREEGRHHPTIQALASAAKEGRKRFVADVNPEFLHRTFSEAFGGSTRAEQVLSSPAIHDMVERHRFAVESVQRRVEQVERRARNANNIRSIASHTMTRGRTPGVRGVSSVSASRAAVPSGTRRTTGNVNRRGHGPVRQSASPPRLPMQAAAASSHAFTGDERTHVHELRSQLAHNDFGHLPFKSQQFEDEVKKDLPGLGSAPDSPMTGVNSKRRETSELPASPSSVKISSIPSSVRSSPSGSPGSMSSGNNSRTSPDKKQIEGELRIIDERRGELTLTEV